MARKDDELTLVFAGVIALMVLGLQVVLLSRLSGKSSDIKVFVNTEDSRFVFPDGCEVIVDRATWHTIKTCSDGTISFIR